MASQPNLLDIVVPKQEKKLHKQSNRPQEL